MHKSATCLCRQAGANEAKLKNYTWLKKINYDSFRYLLHH
jgi:hypothetical protein